MVRRRVESAWSAWERWWFTPRETSTLGVIRIAFGVVSLFWTISLTPTLLTFLGSHGILPHGPHYGKQPGGWSTWSVLQLIPGDGTVIVLHVLMLIASVALIAGFRSRLAALVIFVGLLSIQRRDPYVMNAGDILLRVMALYLVLSPCGAALSLDRWRKHRDRFWESPVRTQWALRLMQIQVTFVYLDSVWAKVRGTHWNDGTAVSIALRIGDLHRFPLPHFLFSSEIIANILTYGALGTEFGVGILVWNRAARPYALLAGVALHLGIDWRLTVGFFSYAVFLFYLSFVDPGAMSRAVLWVRDRVWRLARARSHAPAVARATLD